MYGLVTVGCGHFCFILHPLHAEEDLPVWTQGLPHCLVFSVCWAEVVYARPS